MAVDTKLSSQVELFISCNDLPKMDRLSRSDPFGVVSWIQPNGTRTEIGRTETIYDTHDPQFTTQLRVEYFFEQNQKLRFDIYDEDKKGSHNLSDHDFIGYCEMQLSEILASPGSALRRRLIAKDGSGVRSSKGAATTLTARAEEVSSFNVAFEFTPRAQKLPRMDMFGGADPFFEFCRLREDGHYVVVLRSEVIKKTRNPRWQKVQVDLQRLSNGDLDRPLKLRCWDWNKSGKHDFIGECDFIPRQLLECSENKRALEFQLKRPANRGTRRENKTYGTFIIPAVQATKLHSLLDFVRGGTQIGLMVAVDFTASNGHPLDSTSLHYLQGFAQGMPTQYEQAIRAIGDILAPYDSDQQFPLFGFGARLPNGEVSHCFALTGNEAQPEVHGVDGMLAAYRSAFQWATLSGPTLFTQIVQTAASVASQPYGPGLQHYTVLLILTDGCINDMQRTVDAVCQASQLPLSIVIVGIGAADFSSMETLDGDEQQLRNSRGQPAARDIVQFVPFRKFVQQGAAALARETLAEIPHQFLEYMRLNRIEPMRERAFVAPSESMLRTANTVALMDQGPSHTLQSQPTLRG